MSEFRPPSTVPRPRGSDDSPTTHTSTLSSSRPLTLPPSPTTRARRPSIPMSASLITTSPRSVPVPVPQRHGSMSMHTHARHSPHASLSALPDGMATYPRSISPGPFLLSTSPMSSSMVAPKRQSAQGSQSHHRGASSTASLASLFAPSSAGTGVSFAEEDNLRRAKSDRRRSVVVDGLRSDMRRSSTKESLLNLGEDAGEWLDITGKQILETASAKDDVVKVVKEDMGMEEAVEIMIQSNYQCLLVQKRSSYAFFDYADLNTFLLLVLHATSASPQASRSPSRHVSIKRPTADHSSDSAIADDTAPDASDILDERSKAIVARLRKFEKVLIGSVCDISGKDPYHAFPSTTPLRTLLPLFASGLHKIALTSTPTEPPKIVTDLTVIEHLVSLPVSTQPTIFRLAVSAPSTAFPLHPLISLPGTASVLDAMQVLSLNGLSALGVLSGAGSSRGRQSARRQSSGSSGSSSGALMFRSSSSGDRVDRVAQQSALSVSPLVSPTAEMLASPFDQLGMGGLTSVVTVKECTRVVVPSEGKQVLGMGLEEMVKKVQYVEEAGRDRGEERVPVHTIPYNSTILHAAHLILATSSSRVFLRPPSNADFLPSTAPSSSPPLSPAPSLTTSQSSPPSSPSLSSLSLSDPRPSPGLYTLPTPPPTQLSTHYVVSTLDILSCLARAYHDMLTPPAGVHRIEAVAGTGAEDGTRKRRERDRLRGSIMIPSGGEVGGWGLDPEALRRRRQSSFVSPTIAGVGMEEEKGKEGGFERWRWAGRVKGQVD